ncbi:MAG: hypothetical protein KIS79_10655 [Burkholderiales bacterium]|nr:hypothetical protein [Burkholderiales bacterium]
MMLKKLSARLALTAIATVLVAPLANADLGDRFEALRTPANVIDTVKGNDVRDSKDSTILRNDVRLDDATGDRTSTSAREDDWSERGHVQNMNEDGGGSHAAATQSEGRDNSMQAGAPSAPDELTPRAEDVSPSSDATSDAAAGDSLMPGDGGGEVGSPGPAGTTAETDSFEGSRDTAAGVESTRGAGGAGR